ncbi:MAG: methanogenesis marker 9 domain-containing protein [Methanoregula sp.]|jgi:TIM-barrel protein
MMDAFGRFGLIINNHAVRTPIAIASMAGIVDAQYVLDRKAHAGVAFIGGYAIDAPTMDAARAIAAGGERKEFLYDDPVAALQKELDLLRTCDVVAAINLRGSSPAAFTAIADALGNRVVYEIDAHCRQAPMVAAGSGEYYLKNPGALVAVVKALKEKEVTVSVKMRVGVAADDRALVRALWGAGADILHVDLMDAGIAKLRQIRNSCPLLIIANNSINTFDKMRDMLSHGADLVSLARQSDEHTLAGLDAAITRYADEEGWYNSPKQLCRGGDLRALTFCCMPVKECPLIPALSRIGLSKEEYAQLKLDSVKGTPLEGGPHTCFGSLAWCCKTSSPCMFRDMTLSQEGLTKKEYMRRKRELSDILMSRVFHDVPHDDPC